jgi:ribonuclease T2
MIRSLSVLTVVLVAISGAARAEIALKGQFVAREACAALQSIAKATNPGDVRLEPARAYPLIAKNRPAASHVLVEVAGATPARRWVPVTCGEHLVAADGSDGGAATGGGQGGGGQGGGGGVVVSPPGATGVGYVLAVSWQPAFCETKPSKTECATQTAERYDATHFTLHGLWPQTGEYCNVAAADKTFDANGQWDRLPVPLLEAPTRARLDEVMPGTRSALERHEWIRHGTCFGADTPDDYFARSIALVDDLNASAVRDLVAGGIGAEITTAALREAFDDSFGPGAGARVKVSCVRDGGRPLLLELQIALAGEVGATPSLAELIAAAAPVAAGAGSGCTGGIVDPVGLQ